VRARNGAKPSIGAKYGDDGDREEVSLKWSSSSLLMECVMGFCWVKQAKKMSSDTILGKLNGNNGRSQHLTP
jgi:hypothetical protein